MLDDDSFQQLCELYKQRKENENQEKIAELKERIIARKKVQLKEMEFKHDLVMKLKVFLTLKQNAQVEKGIRKKGEMAKKIMERNKIKRVFGELKKRSLFLPSDKYTDKTKLECKKRFDEYTKNQAIEKEDLLKLIAQAKERLKHENRKKIQVKLLFDQMVLRGISSLNMQAVSLSQNSLKGKFIIYLILYFRCGQLQL